MARTHVRFGGSKTCFWGGPLFALLRKICHVITRVPLAIAPRRASRYAVRRNLVRTENAHLAITNGAVQRLGPTPRHRILARWPRQRSPRAGHAPSYGRSLATHRSRLSPRQLSLQHSNFLGMGHRGMASTHLIPSSMRWTALLCRPSLTPSDRRVSTSRCIATARPSSTRSQRPAAWRLEARRAPPRARARSPQDACDRDAAAARPVCAVDGHRACRTRSG